MKCMQFEELKEHGSPMVYFCEHEMNHSCLIAIPSWNWSFLMDYYFDLENSKARLMRALTRCVYHHNLEGVVDAFYDYALYKL